MNALLSLSLWFLLLMPTCSENVGSHDVELTTDDYDVATVTEDYDYTATFDYYYVTGVYEVRSKAAGIGQLTPVLLLGLAVHQL